jgi:hypothetical protein
MELKIYSSNKKKIDHIHQGTAKRFVCSTKKGKQTHRANDTCV